MPSIPRKTPPPIPPPPRIPPPPQRNPNQKPVPFPRRRPVPEPVSITSSSKIYLNRTTTLKKQNGSVLGACLGQEACLTTKRACTDACACYEKRKYDAYSRLEDVSKDKIRACRKANGACQNEAFLINQEAYLRLSDVSRTKEVWIEDDENDRWCGSRKAWLEENCGKDWSEGCNRHCLNFSETLYVNGSCDSGVISDSSSKSVKNKFVRGEAKLRRIEVKEGFESQEVSLFIGKLNNANNQVALPNLT